MKNSIKISIPTPCHEKWDNMTPADRGRFCAACQKTVVDFTKSTDREIVNAYNKEAGLCGRFRASQLDRNLVIPKEKSSVWAGAAALALIAFAPTEAAAQKAAKEHTQAPIKKRNAKPLEKRIINGIITDETGFPAIGAMITVAETSETAFTDIEGNFTIPANSGNRLTIQYQGYLDCEWTVTDETCCAIALDPDNNQTVTVRTYASVKRITAVSGGLSIQVANTKKRTFLGRVFHYIGGIFR